MIHLSTTIRFVGLCLVAALVGGTGALAQTVGFSLSPEMSFRNVVKTDDTPWSTADSVVDFIERSSADKAVWGFTASTLFVKPFAPRMTFETGIGFAMRGYESPGELPGADNTRFHRYDDPGYTDVQSAYTRQRYYHIGIPFKLAYTSKGGNLRWTWSVGLRPEYMLESRERTFFEFESGHDYQVDSDHFDTPNTFGLTATFSTGVEYFLSRFSSIRIEPVIHYGVLPTFGGEYYDVHLFSYGLNVMFLTDL